jgi:ketosteroid isomerase-like protein
MKGMHMEGKSEIRELEVLGDWAYLRGHLQVAMTTPAGTIVRRAGYTLTILRKEPDGKWRLARDANLLTVQE